MSTVLVQGLSQAEVRDRVLAGQVNTPPPAPGRTVGQILRANVATRFNAILGALFVLVMVVGPPQDALFGVVLAVSTGIGVAQELRARRALDKLAILTAARARVLRDGAVTGSWSPSWRRSRGWPGGRPVIATAPMVVVIDVPPASCAFLASP